LLIYQYESEAFLDVSRCIVMIGQFYWISPPPAPRHLQRR